jgi:hypothetical protein
MATSRVDEAKDQARALGTDAHFGKRRTVDGELGAFDGEAAAFNRAERMNGGDAAGGH